MTMILKAAPITKSKINLLARKVSKLENNGLKPCLHVILVGDNPASLIYVGNKEKFCKKIGVEFKLIKLTQDVSREEFLSQVENINKDPKVTGCFVQLPVPKHLQDIDITQLINPEKDVDGFHFSNIEHIYKNSNKGLLPCTPKGILTLLESSNIEVSGKNVVIIGRSFIVGKPLALLLTNRDATVTLCHSKTRNIEAHTKSADIIICALGSAHFLTKKKLKDDQSQVIIDVGMNSLNGKTVGDCHFDEIVNHVKAITPVPGGVGPMTIFSLMENIIESTQAILNKRNKNVDSTNLSL